MSESGEWHPGSFTKNFSWGDKSGLSELYDVIRTGFDDRMENVPRAQFRERVADSGRPDYIPLNFFLFNKVVEGEDVIIADELVFQALNWEHSEAFDKVALFAFLFSYAGQWKGSKNYQRRPALWATEYVKERFSKSLQWDESKITANDVDSFIRSDQRYTGKTTRKLSTNLHFLLHIGKIGDFSEKRPTRWWIDSLFLALDRLYEDQSVRTQELSYNRYQQIFDDSDFFSLTGGTTTEKNLASRKLIWLYKALGATGRFSSENVKLRMEELLPNLDIPRTNDPTPHGAVHLTNPRILKSIPPMCMELARMAGFHVISSYELEAFDPAEFVKSRTEFGLAQIEAQDFKQSISFEELLADTREK